MFGHRSQPPDFPMQTLRKKTSPCKYKNEPSRFLGEGVFFKAKLIGILEVAEARGDRMCQEALADLKMAIRAAGEHKQRISVHVAIDGLRLRDEKTGDSLYHHPVHKISFIAQDMSDSRAFGYIFGSPDTGHRFFGIKTDKAASQVVIAMRDLFQVVFELKKKEIELAKQQLEGKSLLPASRYLSSAILESSSKNGDTTSGSRSRLASNVGATTSASAANSNVGGSSDGNTVAELVDLEQALSSIERGIHQMDRLSPPTDPFGDSFTPTSVPGILPPPPSSSRGSRSAVNIPSDGGSPFSPPPVRTHFNFEITSSITNTTTSISSSLPSQVSPTATVSPGLSHQSPRKAIERGSIDRSSFEKASITSMNLDNNPMVSPIPTESAQFISESAVSSSIFDVFTELDPLGTGRSKPYVDKKHFFQELKNPQKKVLKDLVGENIIAPPSEGLFPSKFDVSPNTEYLSTLTSVSRQSGGSVSINKPQTASQVFSNTPMFTADPFAETDPFDNTDPFAESLRDDPFNNSVGFPSNMMTEFTCQSKPMDFVKETTLPDTHITSADQSTKIKFLCAALKSDIVPLQVSLPPEPLVRSPKTAKPINNDKSTVRQRPHSGRQPPHMSSSSSPPPPLPPKKAVDRVEISVGPPLPLPSRRRQTPSSNKAALTPPTSSLSWLGSSNTLDDDYLAPVPAIRRPVPSPSAAPSPGLDITLAQLLTCGMDELAGRLNMPAELLSRMTLAQLTGHLHEYLQTGNNTDKADKPPPVAERPPPEKSNEFEANFEENFSGSNTETFEANFDGFNKSNKSSYDRYAVFREIEVETLKPQPIDNLLQSQEEQDSLSSQPDLPCDSITLQADDIGNLKPLSDLNIDSVRITSPPPKEDQILQNTKLEELKNVISNIQKTSLSPTPEIDITNNADIKITENSNKNTISSSDRYAALRDLSVTDEVSRPLSADLTEEPEQFTPLQVPKERKKSDEKSDGFDHSDFFDCIDNSLSLTNQEDAFRKSPMVLKSPEKPAEPAKRSPMQLAAPIQLPSGSISDVGSGSSPEIVLASNRETNIPEKDNGRREKSHRRGDAWALLPGGGQASPPAPSEDGASPWSSDSKESPPQQVKWGRNVSEGSRRHKRNPKSWHTRQTSSSSRDISPWEEDPPKRELGPHSRTYHRERLESGGSCERRDSGGSRERRDSGSGRDRHRRRHKSRDDDDEWSEDRGYSGSRRLSPCARSSSREVRRERAWPGEEHRRPDERGYSTVGRRESNRRRGEPPWQGDDTSHRYSCTMGNRSWRRSGSSAEGDRRSGGGSSGAERSRTRVGPSPASSHRSRPSRHRQHRSPFRDDYFRDRTPSPPPTASPTPVRSRHQHHFFDDFNPSEVDSPVVSKNGARFRFSNDFSEKDSPKSQNSPFENDFVENPSTSRKNSKYESNYASLEKHEKQSSAQRPHFNRFRYDKDQSPENVAPSPVARPARTSPPNSGRSLFEDDFSPESRNGILRVSEGNNGDSCRNNVIPEGEEVGNNREERTEKMVGFDFGPGKDSESRRSLKMNKQRSKPEIDIKKSESVNIFARESDPFDGDDFFSCTASDKPKKDNWRGDFASFDDI